MRVQIRVRLLGVFRGLTGIDRLWLEVDRPNVKNVIKTCAKLFPAEARRFLIDPDLDDPRPNALVLLNGREISVLNGLATKVADGDEITLISVVHGG